MPYYLYEQIDNCPKKGHKKIPPNLKTNSEGNLGYNKITHPNIDMIPSSRTQKYKNLLGGILCPEKVKLMQ